MLIGLATLIMLLLGADFNFYFINELDTGVKEYVLDKERQKEILGDLKVSQKAIKTFNKQRNAKYKTFRTMNTSQETTKEDFAAFAKELRTERIEFQEKVFDDRISIYQKIQPIEWDSIVLLSKEKLKAEILKVQAKAEKKAIGVDDQLFASTRNAITETIADPAKRKILMDGLENMVSSFDELGKKLKSMNSLDGEIYNNKDLSIQELLEISKTANDLRGDFLNDLIDLHFLIKEQTSTKEWDSIMKTFNKELDITTH